MTSIPEHPDLAGYEASSLPCGAKLRYFHTLPSSQVSPADAQALALNAGVRILHYDQTTARTFDDADRPGRGPFRFVGSLVWNPRLHRLTAWTPVDANGTDTATLLSFAASRALAGAPGPRVSERERWLRFVNAGGFPAIRSRVARLVDGDDGAGAVAGAWLPDVVTVEALLNLAGAR